ncbi:EAL domain-containing protein [Porticoccus hydrocarbonoclasticus]|uniref:EAL domain-containing protein n=1 Tax=Porticoccus hydrocarbonoclasticus TaxID=1073414 RepID=UPI0009DF832F
MWSRVRSPSATPSSRRRSIRTAFFVWFLLACSLDFGCISRASRCLLTSLSGANVSIAIDDFGTGYSSLKYLHALPASVPKVDQSFIFALPDDESAASIVEMASPLASRLGMRIVAEGVETLEALDLPTPGYWQPSS